MPQSLLLHSPLEILGTHAHTPGVDFKPPGLGRKPRSTSDIAITLTAGSPHFTIEILILIEKINFCAMTCSFTFEFALYFYFCHRNYFDIYREMCSYIFPQ